MTVLRAETLGKSYRSRRVVNGLSLEVRSGEIVGLLGPNGAGKTTAFYMIVGLIPCDEGRIWLDDQELTHLPMYRRARLGVGYLPQEASVFRKLSVADNIDAILETRADLDDAERRATLESLLEDLHIVSGLDQAGRCRQTADAGACDEDLQALDPIASSSSCRRA